MQYFYFFHNSLISTTAAGFLFCGLCYKFSNVITKEVGNNNKENECTYNYIFFFLFHLSNIQKPTQIIE